MSRGANSSKSRWIAVGWVILLALVGHLYYWYWPRQRAARVDPATGAARLLLEGGGDVGVWIPFPHQNLDAVARIAESPSVREALAAAGGDGFRLPAFGPLAVPPATEMAFTADRAGKRAVLVARVYPLAAALARLAGRLAGNPWLEGGVVSRDGVTTEIGWRGREWRVTVAGGPRGGAVLDPPATPVLAMASLRRPWGVLPEGLYRVERSGRHLDLTMGDPEAPPPAARPGLEDVGLWAIAARRRGGPGGPVAFDALVVEALPGSDLPAAVVFHRGPGRRWSLPGEGLYRLTGARPEGSRWNGWQIVPASDGSVPLAERVRSAVAGLAESEAAGTLSLAAVVDFDASRRALAPILDKLGLLPIDSVRRWVRLAADPGDLGPWSHLSLAVREGDRPSVRLRLWDGLEGPGRVDRTP